MNTLKGNQIKAAELIMASCSTRSYVPMAKIIGQNIGWGLEVREVEDAAEFLQDVVNFIIIDDSSKDGYHFVLTKKGEQFNESNKTIRDIVEEEAEKVVRQLKKEERDEYHKTLQIRELEEKLNTMNAEQKDFWKAQKAKNIQTTLIAIISALFSLITLLKTWGFFG